MNIAINQSYNNISQNILKLLNDLDNHLVLLDKSIYKLLADEKHMENDKLKEFIKRWTNMKCCHFHCKCFMEQLVINKFSFPINIYYWLNVYVTPTLNCIIICLKNLHSVESPTLTNDENFKNLINHVNNFIEITKEIISGINLYFSYDS